MCQQHATAESTEPKSPTWAHAAWVVVAVYTLAQFGAWLVERGTGQSVRLAAVATLEAEPGTVRAGNACDEVGTRCAAMRDADMLGVMICARVGIRAYEETGSARTPPPAHCEAAERALDLYAEGGPAALRGGGWRW